LPSASGVTLGKVSFLNKKIAECLGPSTRQKFHGGWLPLLVREILPSASGKAVFAVCKIFAECPDKLHSAKPQAHDKVQFSSSDYKV
jgi:hypothetical protein